MLEQILEPLVNLFSLYFYDETAAGDAFVLIVQHISTLFGKMFCQKLIYKFKSLKFR